MMESGLHRLMMMAIGVGVFALVWFAMFGGSADQPDEKGFVPDVSQEAVLKSQARTHKY